MMKTTRIILLLGLILCAAQWAQAQVKIGDNPLNLGNDRLLEMERAGELFIVTDSLQIGITTSTTTNLPGTAGIPGDAMMMKLYGYGLGNFGGSQDYFLGTNIEGEVMEFPLTLDLVTNSTTATLSLNNGTSLFGDVDLNNLDSVFTTNIQLGDSIQTIRTLVAANKSNDLDTIQINELIDEAQVIIDPGTGYQTTLRIYEDQHSADVDRAMIDIPLGPFFINYEQVGDTADVLRGEIFYTSDGTLEEDRIVTGDMNSLTFTDIDSFDISSSNTTLVSSGNTIVNSTGNIEATSSTGNVSVTSTTGTVDISGDSDVNITSSNSNVVIDASTDSIALIGSVRLDEQPAKPDLTSYANILGIDADGNVINIAASAILGTETDSVIYRHNGTLTAQRYMTMDGNNLHFVNGTDTTVITTDGRMGIGTGTVTQGTGTANDIRLDVNGDILAIQVHSSSDRRFKKEITQVSDALDKVMAINGVTYKFKTEEFKNKNFPESTQLGFIAQNVEQIIPEVVKTDAAGYKSVDYAKITALLNEAVKEQQAQIASQSDIIKAQQELLSSLAEKYQTMSEEMTSLKANIQGLSNQTMSEE